MSSANSDSHQNTRTAFFIARCALGIALLVGLYFQNPAFALLGGLMIRLLVGINPVKNSGELGRICLQSAVVLLGFTLGLDRLVSVSADYGWIVAIYTMGTLLLGGLLALVVRGDTSEQTLLASGTAICGGTAIASLAPLMGAKPHQLAVTTALVFLLNIVALLTFPAIGHSLGLSQETFGAWVALAIHDTSSVIATATIYGDEAAVVATTVKLGRTLWLIPLAFAVSLIYRQGEAKLRVPAFVILFIAAALSSSIINIEPNLSSGIALVSKGLLVFALGMIGLEINRETLRNMSLRSIIFGVGLWSLVAPAALVLVWWV